MQYTPPPKYTPTTTKKNPPKTGSEYKYKTYNTKLLPICMDSYPNFSLIIFYVYTYTYLTLNNRFQGLH